MGISYLSQDDPSPFHLNLLSGGISILVAFAAAWIFIDRQTQEQKRSVSNSLRNELKAVRQIAARKLTRITTLAFNQPRFGQDLADEYYVKDHYSQLKDLLDGHWVDFVKVHDRNPGRVYAEFLNFTELADEIAQTFRLFSVGLMEFPTVTETLRYFERHFGSQQRDWDRFWEIYRQTEQNLKMSAASVNERPLCPYEFLSNLFKLSSQSLVVMVAITNELKDWNPGPPSQDANRTVLFCGWRRLARNNYKPPWLS